MPVGRNEHIRLRVMPPHRVLRGGTAEECLWTAMRALKTFTLPEVAFAASTDTLTVSQEIAELYLRRLRDAGYVMLQRDATSRAAERWRLVPKMNTGPLAPMLMQVTLTFDRNSRRVFDGPHCAEVLL